VLLEDAHCVFFSRISLMGFMMNVDGWNDKSTLVRNLQSNTTECLHLERATLVVGCYSKTLDLLVHLCKIPRFIDVAHCVFFSRISLMGFMMNVDGWNDKSTLVRNPYISERLVKLLLRLLVLSELVK
jgi:hypothetical protein